LIYFSFMSRFHDKWFTRLFSEPKIVEELLTSFVHESFVKDLDFTTIKKLNTKFIPQSERSRHADLVFEIKSRGHSAYIYLFFEFQSTVDRFMALRMARYLFEFYQETQRLSRSDLLNPPFPILIYNGDATWTAPERFSELVYASSIPKEYIPEFKYFKIAINEIPKRNLVKIRNAVAVAFYIENSTMDDIEKNRKELVTLLSEVFRKDGIEIVNIIKDRLLSLQQLPVESKTISSIEDITEVLSMYETRTKQWEASVLERGIEKGKLIGREEGIEKGIEKGIEQGVEKTQLEIVGKMVLNGMGDADIHKITGMPLEKIRQVRKKLRKK
jgi:predicted transposase/invertase (TIGR01784 family)